MYLDFFTKRKGSSSEFWFCFLVTWFFFIILTVIMWSETGYNPLEKKRTSYLSDTFLMFNLFNVGKEQNGYLNTWRLCVHTCLWDWHDLSSSTKKDGIFKWLDKEFLTPNRLHDNYHKSCPTLNVASSSSILLPMTNFVFSMMIANCS